jgi:putative sigma-54 modulation protein
MGTDATPAEIRVILRHIDPPETAREYALSKLSDDIYSVPNLRDAAVEITYEGTAAIEHRYVMKVTLEANGTTFRVEERAPDVESATNTVHDTLHRQIRDWKEEVYFERRKEVAAYKEGLLDEVSKLPPDNKEGLIIRKESQEMKPMFVEDAAQHLEEIGLDFLFFLNAEIQEYNVVYRRKDGGYGWIVPSYTGLGASDLAEGQ